MNISVTWLSTSHPSVYISEALHVAVHVTPLYGAGYRETGVDAHIPGRGIVYERVGVWSLHTHRK